jgi:hypothetical protein
MEEMTDAGAEIAYSTGRKASNAKHSYAVA